MSRIGKAPINVPSGVDVKVDGQTVTVKGPKGELTQVLPDPISVTIEEGTVLRVSDLDRPEGAVIEDDPEYEVVIISVPRVSADDLAADEAAAEAGAEAGAEGGAEPAEAPAED